MLLLTKQSTLIICKWLFQMTNCIRLPLNQSEQSSFGETRYRIWIIYSLRWHFWKSHLWGNYAARVINLYFQGKRCEHDLSEEEVQIWLSCQYNRVYRTPSYPKACYEEIYKCEKTAQITGKMNNILLSFPMDYKQDSSLSPSPSTSLYFCFYLLLISLACFPSLFLYVSPSSLLLFSFRLQCKDYLCERRKLRVIKNSESSGSGGEGRTH